MQSKKDSMKEILMNTFSGFIVSYLLTLYLKNAGLLETLNPVYLTVLFTIVSLVRSYVWRRLFNKKVKVKNV